MEVKPIRSSVSRADDIERINSQIREGQAGFLMMNKI